MIQVERLRQNTFLVWLAPTLALIAGALILLPLTSALAVVGGALALLALLRWPELALYLLIFAVPYGSWFPIPVSVGNLTAVDFCVALVLALWVARMIVKDRAIVIRWPPLTGPFALLLFAALLSTTVALSLQYAAKEIVKWIEMLAMYVYVANTLDEQKLRRVLTALFVAGASEAAIGIYQFLFHVGPEGFTLFGRFMRAFGTFEQPNPYAGYLELIIPVALGVLIGFLRAGAGFRARGSGSQEAGLSFYTLAIRLAPALLAAASLALMLAALLMSWSRGAWLGAAGALVVVVVLQGRRALVLAGGAAGLLAIVVLLSNLNIIPSEIAARFSGVEDYFTVFDVRGVKVDDSNYAVVERMAHWQAALEMFADHPVLGVGIGNYALAYPVYALPGWSDPLGHAHNYYLNIAAEAGLIGLFAYGILWLAAFWQGWRAVFRSAPARGLAAGLVGVLVALSIHNGFDNLFVHGMYVQVGLVLGMTAWLSAGPAAPF